ncbi:MAG: hypothetical protein Q7S23_03250 [bacterium]|nr:hypothetical protein [bacterium]
MKVLGTPAPEPRQPQRDPLGRLMVGLGIALLLFCLVPFALAFTVHERDRDHLWFFSGTLAVSGIALIMSSKP